MFHALRVPYGVGLGNAECHEEFKQQFMASSGGFRHASASRGQCDGAVGLLGKKPLIGPSLQDPGDRHMADGHPLGEVLHPAGFLALQDLLDGLDVVLCGLRGVISSGLAELVGDRAQLICSMVDRR